MSKSQRGTGRARSSPPRTGPSQRGFDPRDTPLAAVVPSAAAASPCPGGWRPSPASAGPSSWLSRRATCRTYLEAAQPLHPRGRRPPGGYPGGGGAFLARSATRRDRAGSSGPRAASTRVVELAALRRYHRWAVREGLRPDDPTTSISSAPAEPYRDLTALSADQVRSLLGRHPPTATRGPRLRCLLLW